MDDRAYEQLADEAFRSIGDAFEDIDPDGLLSGPSPKLLGRAD